MMTNMIRTNLIPASMMDDLYHLMEGRSAFFQNENMGIRGEEPDQLKGRLNTHLQELKQEKENLSTLNTKCCDREPIVASDRRFVPITLTLSPFLFGLGLDLYKTQTVGLSSLVGLGLTSFLSFDWKSNTLGLVSRISQSVLETSIKVYDARNSVTHRLADESLISDLANDLEASDAYAGAKKTYDFYKNCYRRNSIDDAGMDIVSTIRWRQLERIPFDNACWDQRRQGMLYGTGNGISFGRFTLSLNVIGHELTHGVTQHTTQLKYSGESGALNEHVSDVFGVLLEQYDEKQTADQAKWLIGQEIILDTFREKLRKIDPSYHYTAFRSMDAPGTAYYWKGLDGSERKDGQVAHMQEYQKLKEDNGGVHTNSGIPNKAFCLFAKAIGGEAWDKPGRIWYKTITSNSVKSDATFEQFANATLDSARDFDESTRNALKKAWINVGVLEG